jgi:hypothetical protein
MGQRRALIGHPLFQKIPIEVRQCLTCHQEFSCKETSKQKYCSGKCQLIVAHASAHSKSRGRLLVKRENRECPHCHKIFVCRPKSRQKFCSKSCAAKFHPSVLIELRNAQRGKVRKRMSRYNILGIQWKNIVRARADMTCEACHDTIKVIAHHVIPWKVDAALRYDTNNGVALCISCHNIAHHQLRYDGLVQSREECITRIIKRLSELLNIQNSSVIS